MSMTTKAVPRTGWRIIVIDSCQAGKLKLYRDRRDFRRSPEPSGRLGRKPGSRPIFVIQKHDASQLHYDFRLEIDGVLKSWAIPKGPSLNPREKRLAVSTEDHPLDYADFEGTIPEGEYGGGTVLVWDAGTFRNLTLDDSGRAMSASRGLDQGKLVIELWGRKLRGKWSLVHARIKGDRDSWLLMKLKDEFADGRRKPTSTQPKSVLSGKDLEQIRAQCEAE